MNDIGQRLQAHFTPVLVRLALPLLLLLLFPGVVLAAEQAAGWPPDAQSLLTTIALAFLAPIGLTLMAMGSAEEQRAPQVASAALAAVALSLLGYLLSGFALQYGGVGLVSTLPGLESFRAEWSPFDVSRGPGWGVVGLRGFLLREEGLDIRAYAFFLVEWLPVAVATLIPLVTLAGHVPNVVLLLVGLLMSAVIYPLFGNWVAGGGWLSQLGQTQEWGHGLVDLGATATFVLGGGVALAGIWAFRLRKPPREEPLPLPPVHFPLFMILGALLTLVGWLALSLSHPLLLQEDIHPVTLTGNLFFAAAGGVLVPLFYTWFIAGKPDAWMMARGLVAGVVAAGASLPFVPIWASLLIGAVAGALLPFVLYLGDRLRWSDAFGVSGTLVIPGLWGLLAVGLYASGRWGIGWNGIGEQGYLGSIDQGVTGRWAATGFQTDWPGQFRAQAAGALAALILSVVLPLAFFTLLASFQSGASRLRQVAAEGGALGKRFPRRRAATLATAPSGIEESVGEQAEEKKTDAPSGIEAEGAS